MYHTSGACLNVAFNKKQETIFSVNDNAETKKSLKTSLRHNQSFFYETSLLQCIPQYCLRETTFSFDGLHFITPSSML